MNKKLIVVLMLSLAPACSYASGTGIVTTGDIQANPVFPSSVTAGAFFGDGSHLSGVSGSWNGGTVTNSSTFTASVSIATLTITGIYGLPSRQIFTSGSGTYTRPVGVRQLRIRMVGGGGGGGGLITAPCTAGGNGGVTSFGAVVSTGGIGGTYNNNNSYEGTPGGTGGSGTASLRIPGGDGAPCGSAGGSTWYLSSAGGGSALGPGAGYASNSTGNGRSAPANSGGGGSGAGGSGNTPNTSCGGSGGEYAELIINSPASTYSYVVGGGGNAGSCVEFSGGAGGSGIIIVDEFR